MRFKGLDLNLLVALDTLLAETSVTRSAERLHLTQSAVSCALARLRETLGDELLVQSGRKMVLTPFARELRGQVREILMLIDSTVRSRPDFRPESSQRRFRIACSDFVAEAVLIEVIVGMSRTAPGIRVDLLPLVSGEIYQHLQRGELDLIIAPDHYRRADLLQAPTFNEPWTCVAWARNRTIGDTISLAQYTAAEHVVLQPMGQVALDQHFLEQRRIERRVQVTVPVFTWMPRLLIGTERIATLPGRFAARYARTLPLKTVRPLFDLPPLNESMQWHPSRDRDQALAWLRQSIVAVAGEAAESAGRERS